MRKHRSNTFRIFIEDTCSSQEENKETSKITSSEKIVKGEEAEESESQEEEEGEETSEFEEEKPQKTSDNKKKTSITYNSNNNNNKKKERVPIRIKNNSSEGKKSKMNGNVSEESNNSSGNNLSKTLKKINLIPLKSLKESNRINDKIDIQSNGSKHKGKGVIGICNDDSTYEEESIGYDENQNGEGILGTTVRRSERLKNKTGSMNYSK